MPYVPSQPALVPLSCLPYKRVILILWSPYVLQGHVVLSKFLETVFKEQGKFTGDASEQSEGLIAMLTRAELRLV